MEMGRQVWSVIKEVGELRPSLANQAAEGLSTSLMSPGTACTDKSGYFTKGFLPKASMALLHQGL